MRLVAALVLVLAGAWCLATGARLIRRRATWQRVAIGVYGRLGGRRAALKAWADRRARPAAGVALVVVGAACVVAGAAVAIVR